MRDCWYLFLPMSLCLLACMYVYDTINDLQKDESPRACNENARREQRVREARTAHNKRAHFWWDANSILILKSVILRNISHSSTLSPSSMSSSSHCVESAIFWGIFAIFGWLFLLIYFVEGVYLKLCGEA